MLTGKEDLQQSLIEAFLMEKGTMEFYTNASEISDSGEAKKTFCELAAWEERHMDYIQYLYQSIRGDVEIKSFGEFRKSAEAPLTEAAIPVKGLEAKIEKYTFKDERGALTLAMEIEGKSFNFYHRLSLKSKDANARVFFSEMEAQETKHINYLKDLRLKLIKIYGQTPLERGTPP
ncbi:MAG: ferritin family protein [Nitrospirae bacterium]|nr:ferritin family protein [Nitrospirota bacterium]